MQPGNLSAAVEGSNASMISATLERTRGNISETARVLGLTRRGLYLKMRRLGAGRSYGGYLVTRYTVDLDTN